MKKRQVIFGVVCSGLLIILVVGGLLWHGSKSKNNASLNDRPAASSLSVTPSPVPKKLTATYFLSGDVFWGRGIDYYSKQSPLKDNWAFSRLNEFGPHDGWITDMECPVNDRTVPYDTQVSKLILQCPTHYATTAAKYFTAMTLANNHTGNTGAAGFADTQKNLTNAGIQVFGHYDKSQIQDLCEVISLPAKVNGQAARLPIAMCGYHWLDGEPTDAELAEIPKYAKYFPVWVFPHGGTEYATHHNAAQQALYRKFIDLGASAVFGDHPHVVEDTEAYKGKLIVYDFGNLIYDQWFDNEVTKSMIVKLKLSATVDSNLQSYLNMAKSCMAFKDNCLEQAQQQNLQPPKLTYSYSLMAGDSNNANLATRVKHPGDVSTQAWLLKRANWSETLKGLN